MVKTKRKVGIVGLGLIGASLLKTLAKYDEYEIFCFSNSSYAKAFEYTKNSSNNIFDLKNCDIIFVCCEISKTVYYLEKLNEFLPSQTIVCDVASIKNSLLNKKYNFDFILTHPMAGTEKSGFKAGFDGLFNKAKWLIEKNNKILEEIIQKTGAIPFVIDMQNHDKICAQISHLPIILSFLLFDCAQDEAKEIASSGFRDTTRLAITNSSLALGMFNENKENILKTFNKLVEKMETLKNLSDNEKVEMFQRISEKRKEMYDNDGKNIFKI